VHNQQDFENALASGDLKNGISFTVLNDQGWHRVMVQKENYK